MFQNAVPLGQISCIGSGLASGLKKAGTRVCERSTHTVRPAVGREWGGIIESSGRDGVQQFRPRLGAVEKGGKARKGDLPLTSSVEEFGSGVFKETVYGRSIAR